MRHINYNMRDNMSKGRNNFGKIDTEILLGGGWRIRNSFFAATQRLDWRNMEGYSYNATTERVQVSSYFLIHRNDDLVGNQTDVRKTFDLAGHTVNFIGGFSYQDNYQLRGVTPPGVSFTFNVDPYNPAPIFDPGLPWVHGRTVIVKTKAAFAEAQTSVTDKLKVVTGIRWEGINVEHDNKLTGIVDVTDFQPVTGRLGAVYSITPNINLYTSYSRAQEPTTQLVSYDASQQAFHMTPSWQIESGAKATAWRGRLDGTLAYYYIQKRDIPIRTEIDGVILQQQVGKQRSQGVELNLVARPTSSLSLVGDLAVTLGEFLEFNENQGTGFISRAGNVPAGIPDIIWSLTPSQRFGPLTLAASARTVGGRWADNANSRRRSQYTTFDAWVSYRLPTERHIQLTFRGRNLTDELYVPGGGSNTSGRVAAPRALEVSMNASF
jgi:iron complex outermembrane receptor protein